MYYLLTFYLAGVYAGSDYFKCRGIAHALRQAEYIKLAFVRHAVNRPFSPNSVTFDVSSVSGESAAHVNLATCVS